MSRIIKVVVITASLFSGFVTLDGQNAEAKPSRKPVTARTSRPIPPPRTRVTITPVAVAGEGEASGNSTSAALAAKLKSNPPRGFIEHYLPDDRYKVAGRIWKVVSSELDTFYHRPACPNMLKQPAGIVLGFASAPDAVEAGYRACTTCRAPVPPTVFTPTPAQQRDTQQARANALTITEQDYEMFHSIMGSVGPLTWAQQAFKASTKFKILWSEGQQQFQNRAIDIARRGPPPEIKVTIRRRR